MSDPNQMLKVGEGEISLADLIGFDMTNVEAKKFENLVEGVFDFEIVTDPMPGVYVVGDPPKGSAVIPCKVLNVIALKNPSETPDPTKLIGFVHRETNVINSADSLGYLMTTLEAFGAQKAQLGAMLEGLAGIRFRASIVHRVNKNNTDIIYAGLSRITNVVRPQAAGLSNTLGQAKK